ncbi:GNAT family N-acetyltransferase [Kribbella sandramycini]|uniref:GNAT family N-acetyltransferase n=1 Tax=Kribbella sandramycini TaxID=60450 RepID=A0A7Y4P1U0_9ACTN|nr:GNAT family N-acetyltransferase [Kribbella sandramycini]MBB6564769.1 ribosomal protein S18 acetylase RimI-like enzyme [Kribbella sandramycini]NOL42470.1 GNAT family N-acetyltransferase [Kribbella sandramycini]
MIAVLDQIAALGIAAELGEVFAAAFAADDPSADAVRFATEQLPTHAARDDFKLVTYETPVAGFAYGFTGYPGQWWSDRIAGAVSPELAADWIGGHFEVVELAVRPSARCQGIGAELMTALVDGLPQRRALLTTYADDRPAPRLYRRLGWQLLVEDLGWGSALYGLELLDRGVPGVR